MGQIYFLGTFEDKQVNQPFQFAGSWHRVLVDLLQKSNVNIFKDFHFCVTIGDVHDPLFYKVTEDNRHLLEMDEETKLESEEVWQEDIYLEEIKSFPLICDEVIREGTSYHLIMDKVKDPQYSHIKPLSIDLSYLKNEYSSQEEWLLKDILEYYNSIMSWVKNNQKVYYYRYA